MAPDIQMPIGAVSRPSATSNTCHRAGGITFQSWAQPWNGTEATAPRATVTAITKGSLGTARTG